MVSNLLSVRTDSSYVADGMIALHVAGEIDLANAEDLRSTLIGAVELGNVLVDVSEVRFMDARGLAAVLDADSRARELGRHVRLRRPSAAVHRLLSVTGLDDELLADGPNAFRPASG